MSHTNDVTTKMSTTDKNCSGKTGISLLISNAETINGEIKQMSRFKYLGNKLRAPKYLRNVE